jgi:hypothetical protein
VVTAGKMCGFTKSHAITTATGTSTHQPIQTRLQIARTIAGIAANRV